MTTLRAMAALALFTLTATAPVRAANFALLSPDAIAVTGRIDQGDCERWNAAITPTVATVVLKSPGGVQGQGQCISRSIAAHHMKTLVPAHCSSICFLMFAAGAERWACDGARIGVHRPHSIETGEEIDPKHTETILRYAARYGVPQPILDKLAATPAKLIYVLNDEELASMNVRRCGGTN
jgi:hypothetical protein